MSGWFKSSFSDSASSCVEVVFDGEGFVLVQSTEGGHSISFNKIEWDAFVAGVKAGEFDWPTTD